MNPTPIIEAGSFAGGDLFRALNHGALNVSEFFCDTIQGEGIYIGHPAAFIRLTGCTLNCKWCDSAAIWKHGSSYTFQELFYLMINADLISKFKNGQHLVITGGSPLLQQEKVVQFIEEFIIRYNFKPFIEIENECTLMPSDKLISYIDCWNNSPKTENSGTSWRQRYHVDILKKLSSINNSWFKFVVEDEADWNEIETHYLYPKLIKKSQVILMPKANNLVELQLNREKVLSIAVYENVRYSTREQIVLWDAKPGV